MIERSVIEQLTEFDSALLANTLDAIDSTPSHEFYMGGDIHSVTPPLGPTVGLALTCQMDTSTPGEKSDQEMYWKLLDLLDAMDAPAVWVIQTVGSRPEHECVLGDGMAKTWYAAGCCGAVTNGRVRDVEGLITTPFAVYCRGTAIHHCAVRTKAINVPIEVGGITVNPNDIIHASTEGVIKIPPASAERLIAEAPKMRAFEHEVHAMLRRTDVSLDEKRHRVKPIFDKYGFAK